MQLIKLDRIYADIREQAIQNFVRPLSRIFQARIILSYAKRIKSELLPDIRKELFEQLIGESNIETTEIKVKIARKVENIPECFFTLRYLGISYRSPENKAEFYPLFKLPKLYTSRARAGLTKTSKVNLINAKVELLSTFALYDCNKCSSHSNWWVTPFSNPAVPKSHNACCLALIILNNREQRNVEVYRASSDRQMEITHYWSEEEIERLVELNMIVRKVVEHVESYGLLLAMNRDVPLKLKLRFVECVLSVTKFPKLPEL